MSMHNSLKKKPVYLLAGNRSSNRHGSDPILRDIVQSTGTGEPAVAYLGAANGDDREFFQWISRHLKESGAGAVTLAPTASDRVDIQKTRTILESADIIFVGGGDVERGMEVINRRALAAFLNSRYNAGALFMGVSAGSIMLASQWVRWEDPEDDTTTRLLPCMNLVPVLVDTHGEADGWEELIFLLKLSPDGAIGYGIPSGGVLRVTPDGGVIALGCATHRFIKESGGVARLADLAV